jgi:hypothetical protein
MTNTDWACAGFYLVPGSHFPVWCTSSDESRRQIVLCPPVYAAGLAISPCGADGCAHRAAQYIRLCQKSRFLRSVRGHDLLNNRVQGLKFITVFTSSRLINRITLFYKNMYNLYIHVTSVPTCSSKTELIGTMSTTSDAPDVISVDFLTSYNVIN